MWQRMIRHDPTTHLPND